MTSQPVHVLTFEYLHRLCIFTYAAQQQRPLFI